MVRSALLRLAGVLLALLVAQGPEGHALPIEGARIEVVPPEQEHKGLGEW